MRAEWKLYTSHAFSSWGERMWEFTASLVLLKLLNGSLLLVSIQGVVSGAATLLCGSPLGHWVDRADRLSAARTLYMIQNLSVAISGAAALVALGILRDRQSIGFILLITLSILFTSSSHLATMGTTLAVEKGWTKRLCCEDSAQLARMNAGMRRIDLTCLILSPILVGFMMTYTNVSVAVLLVVIWNLVSWVPEWTLLQSAYSQCDALRAPDLEETTVASKTSAWKEVFSLSGWAIYFQQSTALFAFSLALVYMTVLSFGALMTAYLNAEGMTEAELSVFRGLGAIAGVSATFLFPVMHKLVGLEMSGALGVWFQFGFCLLSTIPVLPIAIGLSQTVSTRLIAAGLVFSRMGLWLFDLSVSQMLQEQIDNSALGKVNGVQSALCSLFSLLSFVAGILSPSTREFKWLMLGSVVVVFIAVVLYTLRWALLVRSRRSAEASATELELNPILD